MNEEAPFETVDHALKHAFGAEARDTTVISQFLNDLRGSTIKEVTGLSRWDHVAQAAITISVASKTLMEPDRDFMIAMYTLPIGGKLGLVNRKELLCKFVSQRLYEELEKKIDRWFINDVTRSYCGLGRQHTDRWWSDHLGVSERHIRRLKSGYRDKPGINPTLDYYHDKMAKRLGLVFYETGLVKYSN